MFCLDPTSPGNGEAVQCRHCVPMKLTPSVHTGTKSDERLKNLKSMLEKLEGMQDEIRACSASIDRLKDSVADRGGPSGDVRAVKEQQAVFKQLLKQQIEPVQKQVREKQCVCDVYMKIPIGRSVIFLIGRSCVFGAVNVTHTSRIWTRKKVPKIF